MYIKHVKHILKHVVTYYNFGPLLLALKVINTNKEEQSVKV